MSQLSWTVAPGPAIGRIYHRLRPRRAVTGRGVESARRDVGRDRDLDLVADLQRAHEPAVRLDAPGALGERDRGADRAAVAHAHVCRERSGAAGHGELAFDGEPAAVLDGPHGAGAKRDGMTA